MICAPENEVLDIHIKTGFRTSQSYLRISRGGRKTSGIVTVQSVNQALSSPSCVNGLAKRQGGSGLRAGDNPAVFTTSKFSSMAHFDDELAVNPRYHEERLPGRYTLRFPAHARVV